jgi:uncharacterized damage-inducible protein DinB
MITPAYIQTMAAYNAEMNRRLYNAAAELGDDARRADGGAFWRSIHGTFNHLLWADEIWMSRFAGWPKPTATGTESPDYVAEFDEMKRRRFDLDARIERWAETVEPAFIEGDLTWYSGLQNREMTASKALVIVHFFNHQTHHRGQAHALLTRAGRKTGDTDIWMIL